MAVQPPPDESVVPDVLQCVRLLVLDADELGPTRIADRLLGTGVGDFGVNGVRSLARALEHLDAEAVDIVLVGNIDAPCSPVNALRQLRNAAPRALVLPLGAQGEPQFSDTAWLGQTLRFITRRRTLAAAYCAGDGSDRSRDAVADTGVAACPDAVLTTDRQGRLTTINPPAERLTGWSRSDALGHHAASVLVIRHAISGTVTPCPAAAAIREDQVIDLCAETVLCDPHGRNIPVQYSAAPIHDNTAAVTGGVIVLRGLPPNRADGQHPPSHTPAGRGAIDPGEGGPAAADSRSERTPGPIAGARATEQLISTAAQQAFGSRGLRLRYQPECEPDAGWIHGLCAITDSRPSVQEWHSAPRGYTGADTRPSSYRALRTACQQLRDWNEAGLCPPRLSVDVSTAGLERLGFASRITEILQTTGVNPEQLELVFGHRVIEAGGDAVPRTLATLRELGIALAVNDFGTGDGGLRRLNHVPIETLKVDPRLLRDIATNERARLVAAGMMDLAKRLGYRLIAQGVDTPAQHALVREHGCDGVRGRHFGHPIDARDAGLLVAMNRATSGRASA